MTRIILKRGEEDRHLKGHPWIFDNEIESIICNNGKTHTNDITKLQCGEIADVETCRKKYVGRAFVNPQSKIVARLYSTSKEGVDEGFFRRRIRNAVNARTQYDLKSECARLVFAEADFLPGLIIDQYVGWDAKYLVDIDASKAIKIPAAERRFIFVLPESCTSGLIPSVTPQSGGVLNPTARITFQNLQEKLIPAKKWLCIQFLSYAMEQRKNEIIAALEYVIQTSGGTQDAMLEQSDCGERTSCEHRISIEGIIEKSAAPVREKEGLPQFEGIIKGSYPEGGIVIFENGFPFIVDLIGGQKTGHYLDQRDNHYLCAQYARSIGLRSAVDGLDINLSPTNVSSKKLRVLDTFCYSGGFSINICKNCDAEITAVDSSAAALSALKMNAKLNNVHSSITTVCENVFDFFKRYEQRREHFDLIILDPPAFAKSRSAMEAAIRGYKEINLKAIKLLRHGGILVTCSCSYAMTEEKFKDIIADAAFDAGKRLVQLDFRSQSSDHPILVSYNESKYLKCGYYKVV
ncbi:MAG: class I SAM-dependent rRNA methyltransferase [Termitinemataceae bacterium]|nr:MAG: class I SAM-dependent rRNA methyltransferase [Termitinemataceae bacterium]